MTKSQRQLAILGLLVVTLVVIVVVRFRPGPTAAIPPPSSNTAAPAVTAPTSGAPVNDVKLNSLRNTREPLAEPDRNPFQFERKAPPQAVVQSAPPPPEAMQPPIPAGPPPPPPIPLRFIGLIEAPGQGGRIATMSDGRGNVFFGKEGDIIEGRYRLIRVGSDSAELSYTDGRGRQTIRLSGQ